MHDNAIMQLARDDKAAQGLLFGQESGDEEEDLYPSRRIILASGDENWCSPPEVLDPIHEFSPIIFDPFSNDFSLVGAEVSIKPPEDSLLIDWPLGVLIFCNPPYGRALAACARKIAQQAARGCEIVTLVPARVGTRWWKDELCPSVWCAWAGRITFLETVDSLEKRFAERLEKAKRANKKEMPKKPKYKLVGPNLARAETATFDAALTYAGPRRQRFIEHFAAYGTIYEKARLAA